MHLFLWRCSSDAPSSVMVRNCVQERLRQQAIKDAEKERANFYAKQKEGQKDVRAKYREKVKDFVLWIIAAAPFSSQLNHSSTRLRNLRFPQQKRNLPRRTRRTGQGSPRLIQTIRLHVSLRVKIFWQLLLIIFWGMETRMIILFMNKNTLIII